MKQAVATSPEGSSRAPRVSFCTLGCRLNQYDTSALRARLLSQGMVEARAEEGAADVVLVNTCTVTGRADQEARQLIRKLHRESPGARIVVTGCYAQRAPEEVRAIPGVTAVLGTADRDDPDRLMRAVGWNGRAAAGTGSPAGEGVGAPFLGVGPARAPRDFTTQAPLHVGRSRALLKIQDGCDSFCSYCIVPYVRGRSRSLARAEVLERARRLLETGFTEIVLTGADLGSYGKDLGEREALARLAVALLSLGPDHRVRLSSIEPNKLGPRIVEMIGAEPRLCRHLHLPLQSGSNRVLGAMRRGYTREEYAAILDRVVARGPVGIGADVIVGFPGEGEEEFAETLQFLWDQPVTFLHVFRYSPRPGTRAARLEAGEPAATVRERAESLRKLGEEKLRAFRRSLLGSTLPVVMEQGRGADGPVSMSDLYLPVELDREPPNRRGILHVTISGEDGARLLGRLDPRTCDPENGSKLRTSDGLTLAGPLDILPTASRSDRNQGGDCHVDSQESGLAPDHGRGRGVRLPEPERPRDGDPDPGSGILQRPAPDRALRRLRAGDAPRLPPHPGELPERPRDHGAALPGEPEPEAGAAVPS
ncbi:MAG: tRNA (N(6)-L-threonylcarbamoyladenosine(37)-C(2))-methylthiotransferase MtaB [Candidatus Eisenbacteria bacterium]|uniref:tRNA (N(6)-L-threonylcarbamoyladenosine(37)-C(2))-methylthiotransferase MtaB n=1 Tax=Eiseniibacteriota bacterium TaxID=2212470 RepID=A0A538SI24_UNCEI|nr:MAG: tRNA (N(6)-L-threonylcarbamoyladenosine(37)-C(2))-methylthiotransferase MtaB [Candidatus Eisenbacteria bacterium]